MGNCHVKRSLRIDVFHNKILTRSSGPKKMKLQEHGGLSATIIITGVIILRMITTCQERGPRMRWKEQFHNRV
jgi:hypothetical protein